MSSLSQAEEFRQRIESARQSLGPQPFEWYPYDSFGNVERWLALLGPKRTVLNLAGQGPVLDIGCADGALAFLLESLGVEVEALDLPSANFNAMQGIRALARFLDSGIAIHQQDLDSRFELPRHYSLALFLGILYHLKNPYGVLEAIARRARWCIGSTRIAGRTPQGAAIAEEPVAYLLDHAQANADPTNFWIFSEAGLRRVLSRSGWEIRAFLTAGSPEGDPAASDPIDPNRDTRAFFLLESRLTPAPHRARLVSGFYPLEDNWRWTARSFSVITQPAVSPLEHTLEFRFHLMRPGPVTLRARVERAELPPQTFTGPGEHVYRAELPLSIDPTVPLPVTFELDSAHAVSPEDDRELGVIVSFYCPGYAVSDSNLPLTLS